MAHDQAGSGQPIRRPRGKLGQGGDLARAQRSPGNAIAAIDLRGHYLALRGQAQPALEARPTGGAAERPVEHDDAFRGQRRSRRRRPARPSGAASSRTGRGPFDSWSTRSSSTSSRSPAGDAAARGQLGHELESLKQTRRQHRPQDERGRRQVVVRDRTSQPQREGRQERTVGAHPVGDGFRLGGGRHTRLGEDDPERLAAPELHEYGLAGQ